MLKCYPKYIRNQDGLKKKMCQILRVLEKYNKSKEQKMPMFQDGGEGSSFDLLSVMLFLIWDYFENGIYRNTEDIIESNVAGEILWDRTINGTFPLLAQNRPYYIDLRTRRRITNDFDFFKRLHECILTKVSKEMKDADLLDLFEMTEIYLTDEELEEFGDKEYILYRIENELRMQFNTRKQWILKALYAYVDHSGSLYDIEDLTLFGTKSFQNVWETVCKDIMDDQLKRPLDLLFPKLPRKLQKKYQEEGCKTLLDIIEKPMWTETNRRAQATLIPDAIAIDADQNQFVIIDAKYYTPKLNPDKENKNPQGQPGIESIIKQYMYHLAYREFISGYSFKSAKNCFLMPTENTEIENHGEVSMDMMRDIDLENIQVRFLPAEKAYDDYLHGRKMEIGKLGL